MKIGSLFSGYGGLDMATEAAFGATTAWVSDIDPGSRKILAHRYPGVPNLGDITAVDWSSVEPVDIVTGGSPCQDLSHAGKRGGMTEGTRSNLWVAMRTAIAQLRPTYVVWENVRGAYSAEADSEMGWCSRCLVRHRAGGKTLPALRALGRVVGDLSDLGYDCRWTGLPASAVGFAHGRFRVFLLATLADAECSGRLRWSGKLGSAGRPEPTDGRLLPTPSVADALGGHLTRSGARSSELLLPGVAKQLGSLLPTPSAVDGSSGHTHNNRGELLLPGVARHLGSLLPTPRATDGTKGGPNQRGSSGDLMLPSAVSRLLPTPTVADAGQSGGDPETSNVTLTDATARARIPWGEYAQAVARQESLTRPAPPPTERAPKGGQRLSCRFDEWLMGLPDGWITDIPGITHNEALKACGNGVVPQQAYAALAQMLRARAVAA